MFFNRFVMRPLRDKAADDLAAAGSGECKTPGVDVDALIEKLVPKLMAKVTD